MDATTHLCCGCYIPLIQHPYTITRTHREGWNWIDFVVVVTSLVTLDDNIQAQFSALRTIRVLRPLRTLTRINGMCVYYVFALCTCTTCVLCPLRVLTRVKGGRVSECMPICVCARACVSTIRVLSPLHALASIEGTCVHYAFVLHGKCVCACVCCCCCSLRLCLFSFLFTAGMRTLVNTFLRSFKALGNVVLLLAFFLLVYGILGSHSYTYTP